jgi:sulfate adenylyltransferase
MAEFKQIAPHGGILVNRILTGDMLADAQARAESLKQVVLTDQNLADLEMIANGGLSPLTGFMNKADYESVVFKMHTASGLPWTLPITLAVSAEFASTVKEGEEIALVENATSGNRIVGILTVSEKFTYDKEVEAQNVYRTTEDKHPGVANVYKQGDVLLAGDVWQLRESERAQYDFPELRYSPLQTRELFAEKGWRRIVGFQTRNPIHRAHEYIQKTALEVVDGLFLHPLVGQTKTDDVPADVRVESYRAILSDWYPANRVLLGVFPAAMRYAGPREAFFHAITRKNYGCTHFIVGRDAAGVGKYYGTYDAHYIFDEFDPQLVGITPLFFEHTFFCKKCGTVVSGKTCPHDSSNHIVLSGTQVREMLSKGENLPVEFTRPEVSAILMRAYQSA